MSNAAFNSAFSDVLEPLGPKAADFFLAASLYHARQVSFEAAAHLAGLDFESFHERLVEHFGAGFMLADEVILEDMETVDEL